MSSSHTERPPFVPTYRDYNRLLRNQVLIAMAVEHMATRLSGSSCEAAAICRQLVIEVEEFERNSSDEPSNVSTGDSR